MATDPVDHPWRVHNRAQRDLLNFLPAGFIECLRACEVDGKVVAPSAHPRNDGQQVIENDTDYSTLITTMIEMSERDRVFGGLLRFGADASGVGAAR